MSNNTLHQRSVAQAERFFMLNTGIAVACAAFVYFVIGNEIITGIILALAAWHIATRVLKGPPVGIALLEVKDGYLFLRNPAARPARIDRIELAKLHSVRLMGEGSNVRYFDCTLSSGEIAHIGPFERGQGEMAVAEFFYRTLPDTPFIVDTSASPEAQAHLGERPPGL